MPRLPEMPSHIPCPLKLKPSDAPAHRCTQTLPLTYRPKFHIISAADFPAETSTRSMGPRSYKRTVYIYLPPHLPPIPKRHSSPLHPVMIPTPHTIFHRPRTFY